MTQEAFELQLTVTNAAPILKDMPVNVAETDESQQEKRQGNRVDKHKRNNDDERGLQEQKQIKLQAEAKKQVEKQIRATQRAEKAARIALDSLKEQETTKIPKTEVLLREYDTLANLQEQLAHSNDRELTRELVQQIRNIEAELRLKGIEPGRPEHELNAVAELPSTYSVKLLNNITQAALGIAVIQVDGITGIQSADSGKLIQVPAKGALTIEDTLAIAREVTRANPEILTKRGEEITKFGRNIKELALYLSGQSYKGGESIFQTEEQKQAMVQLYNAGIWLEKLANPKNTQSNLRWEDLQRKGQEFVKSDEFTDKRKVELLGFLFGKSLGKGRVPTSYQRLLAKFHGDQDALNSWLLTKGNRMVGMLAPRIAESFSQGQGAAGVVRGAKQIGEQVPEVVFDVARERIREVELRLPEEIERRLKRQYGESFRLDTTNLLEAAKTIHERSAGLSSQEQLAQLNDLVRHFTVPGETEGESVTGYELGKVFTNPDAEIGCSVRSYLLARILREVYPSADTQVVANTMLLPDGKGGYVGHTRLMVAMGDSGYIVDPSEIPGLGGRSGVAVITNRELLEQITQVQERGELNIFDPSEKNQVSQHQWIGDPFKSQEANILVNIAAGVKGEEKKQLLQLALQKDPYNQIALLGLARLFEEEEQKQYTTQIQKLNPLLTSDILNDVLKSEVIVAATIFPNAGYPGEVNNLLIIALRQFAQRYPGAPNIPTGDDLGTVVNPDLLRELHSELSRLSVVPGALLNDLQGEILVAERRENSPKAIQERFQRAMHKIEINTSSNTGVETGYGVNSREISEIVNLIAKAEQLSREPGLSNDERKVYEVVSRGLKAEYTVRTAAHDITYYGQTFGDQGIGQMNQAGSRIATPDLLLVEHLPGVTFVRRLYEQEACRYLAEHGGLGTSSFEAIQQEVEKRAERLRSSIQGYSRRAIDDLEFERAKAVGRNMFVLKTRLGHFVALGSVSGANLGSTIGKSHWDFLAAIYEPWKWKVQRYKTVPHSALPIVKFLGEEKINRILNLQDHDSSGWRGPNVFIPAFNSLVDMDGNTGENKLALYMRLFHSGAKIGRKGEKEIERKGEKLKAYRISLVKDIIHFVPEDLVAIFKGYKKIDDLFGTPGTTQYTDYQNFLTEIMRIRQLSLNEGDYNYRNFDGRMSTSHYHDLYKSLTDFLNDHISELADPNSKVGVGENKQQNPLMGKRVWSMSDAPLDIIEAKTDIVGAGTNTIERITADKKVADGLGVQTIGREWGNVQGAHGAGQAVDAFLAAPSEKTIEGLVNKFFYKGWTHDTQVRDDCFEALVKYVQEDPALRTLLPGIDRVLGRLLRGGASEAQRAMGPQSEAYDTLELVGMIKNAVSHHLISQKKAGELLQMVDFLGLFKAFPLIQIFIAIAIVSMLKTAGSLKTLTAA